MSSVKSDKSISCKKGKNNSLLKMSSQKNHEKPSCESTLSDSDNQKCLSLNDKFSMLSKVHKGKHISCPDCGKCFGRNSQLLVHRRNHTGEKPFKCSDCGESFTKKCTLIRHTTIHMGEKKFFCRYCDEIFSKKRHLTQHLDSFHGAENPFSCVDCGERFSRNANLIEHRKSNVGEEAFPCRRCGQVFMVKSCILSQKKDHCHCSDCKKYICKESDAVIDQITSDEKVFTSDGLVGCSSNSSFGMNNPQQQTVSLEEDKGSVNPSIVGIIANKLTVKQEVDIHGFPFVSAVEEDFQQCESKFNPSNVGISSKELTVKQEVETHDLPSLGVVEDDVHHYDLKIKEEDAS